ncbi:MAG: isochorismatase family protein [Fimbriiglobus sp.]|nr:isochorismatase family protein [Fimbriiglobus sp.]
MLRTLLAALTLAAPVVAADLKLAVQTRDAKDQPITADKVIDPKTTAVVICDMWDDHWCKAASARCDALAKKAAPVVEGLRKAGATIIHCPSDTMDFYKDSQARRRAKETPKANPPKSNDLPSPPLPIDDSDGGCDDIPQPNSRKAWSRQHTAIAVDENADFVTDSGTEVFNILTARGLKTVLVMGVHTNMCVLNRSFAIKQMRRWGVDCLLVRDLTDSMYNPKKSPFVTHDEGTQLVIGYIERHWCPSVTSDQLTGKP